MNILKKIALAAGLSFFGIFLALGAVELGLRILTGLSEPAQRWTDRPAFYFKDESAATLQDFALVSEKPANTFRVVVVGDSYTFAPFMQFTDAFPKVLERMLNLNSGVRKVEVINLGVPGYSTSHEIESVEQAVQLQADLILLQITLNDPEVKPYRPTGIRYVRGFGALKIDRPNAIELGEWKNFDLVRRGVNRVVRHSKILQYVGTRLSNKQSVSDYIEYFFDLFESPTTWNSFTVSLKKIADTARGANIPVVGVVFPLFGTSLDQQYPFSPLHEKVGGVLQQNTVPYVDLYSVYAGIPLERLQVIPGEDRHPNEIAHRMAAEAIYLWLAKHEFLPKELLIKDIFKGRTQLIKEERASF